MGGNSTHHHERGGDGITPTSPASISSRENLPSPLRVWNGEAMLSERDIREIQGFLDRWQPTSAVVLNLRPGVEASPQRLERLLSSTLHRIERWCYGRRTKSVEAVAWAEVGRQRNRLHLHIVARFPTPTRLPLDADRLASAWWSSARGIAAGDIYFAPLTDPLGAYIYSQKGGGEMMAYTIQR